MRRRYATMWLLSCVGTTTTIAQAPDSGAGPMRSAASRAGTLWSRTAQDTLPDAGARWALLLRRTFFSPQGAARMILPGVVTQVTNDPASWGRTPEGLGRRVGQTVASVSGRELLLHAGAAAFAVDPRYEVCGCVRATQRSGHALSGVVMLASGSGERRVVPVHVLTAVGSGALDAALSGAGAVTVQQVAQRAAIRLAGVALTNVALEFRPDVKRGVRRLFRRPRQ